MRGAPALLESWIDSWHRRRAPAGRWVVVDTETSGLDPGSDALLAIGAVAVDEEGIVVEDRFEIVLRGDRSGDPPDIAVRGIGHGARAEGVAVPAALLPGPYRDGGRSLDDWLAALEIECSIRHNAASDALATAELLLRLRAMAAMQGTREFAALLEVSRQQKWLGNAD